MQPVINAPEIATAENSSCLMAKLPCVYLQ